MKKEFVVNITVADLNFALKTTAEDEELVRQAEILILKHKKKYESEGYKDIREIMSMIAVDSLVARLKGDKAYNELHEMVLKNVADLKDELKDKPSFN
jgi:non-homologous end joining protein Ku